MIVKLEYTLQTLRPNNLTLLFAMKISNLTKAKSNVKVN